MPSEIDISNPQGASIEHGHFKLYEEDTDAPNAMR